MDRQISVFLLFVLFTAGHSFSCYQCTGLLGSCENQVVKTCPSGFSKCMSLTTVGQIGGIRGKLKIKDCAADCPSGFMNVGVVKTSYACCNTDQCNLLDAPDPSDIPNGNKCYSCDEKSCSNILSCSGDEDRCFTATGTVSGQSTDLKGCISKSICDAVRPVRDIERRSVRDIERRSVTNIESASCCEGNLCNSAKSVTQSFLFLCCFLIAFFLLH